MTRHSMLLTAVATVTLPCLVAVAGVVGYGHRAAGVAPGDAAAAGSPLTGPSLATPATSSAAVRDNVATVRSIAGVPVIVFTKMAARQRAAGTRLLNQAAAAASATTYQGTEQLSEPGVAGTVTMTAQVLHQGGGPTLVTSSSAASSGTATSGTATASTSSTSSTASTGTATSTTGSDSPEGVFGVTKSLVGLLAANYVAVERDGRGTVAGRSTAVVKLYRFDGSVAAEYWLDEQTSLPLRREVFDTSGHLIGEDEFVSVKVGPGAAGAAGAGAAAAVQPAAVQPTPAPAAWATVASAGQLRASLAAQGWPVPASLLGGLPLQTAAWTRTSDGKVVDLEYTDGLFVVSLFVERGDLASSLPGWQQVKLAGQQAYASGGTVTWAGPGVVYTMISDVPSQTVTQVVAALPGSPAAGPLDRLGHGLVRLAHVFIPFS